MVLKDDKDFELETMKLLQGYALANSREQTK